MHVYPKTRHSRRYYYYYIIIIITTTIILYETLTCVCLLIKSVRDACSFFFSIHLIEYQDAMDEHFYTVYVNHL